MNKNTVKFIGIAGTGIVLKLFSLWNKLTDEEKKEIITLGCGIFYRIFTDMYENKKQKEREYEDLKREQEKSYDAERKDEQEEEYERSLREAYENAMRDLKKPKGNLKTAVNQNGLVIIDKKDVLSLMNPNGIPSSNTNLSIFKDSVSSLAADEGFMKIVSERLSSPLPNETKSQYGKRAKEIAIEEMEKHFKIKS